ncbi:Putative vacuolar protein sorting-associated protein [Seminavis robusta]|uniref:Vacuolar protein sorting-associated protein n=1 Tax=Seminavis robusta TaxID=568900 RepID=A0A9N8EA38_9STRA|nr:Putative vacuolar protein sorting-associated protein [Seminavis robusta]|eukprot:Sro714_g191730.1 Putative vacuolar protein sorting-associated protein (6262) ;mRNA; r:30242-49605
MASYMYNPSKTVTEIMSKYLEFDPEQLQLGIWSGDLVLTNVNLRGDALYSKINRMKKSPSGRDPLKLKIVEGTIGQLRIQIPWKRLVWGQGDVVIDIKGVNVVVGFESREETEAKQKATEAAEDKKAKKQKDEKADEETVQYSKEFRDAKQRILAAAEQRLMKGQQLSAWLTHMIKKELNVDNDKNKVVGPKKPKGFDKWMKKASSNFVWRFLSGLCLNIEGFKLTVVQDNIEMGIIMPNTHIHSGKMGSSQGPKVDNPDDGKSFDREPEPGEVEDGDNIDKSINALGVSVFVRRQIIYPNEPLSQALLLPDDYVLRPIDMGCSLSFFYPHEEQSKKRKTANGTAAGVSDGISMADSTDGSSKRRRGKRDKRPRPGSFDGTAETDVVSSFGPDSTGLQRQRSQYSSYTEAMRRAPSRPNLSNQRPSSQIGSRLLTPPQLQRRVTSSGRSAPLVRPDDLSSVYKSAMAESKQVTPKLDMQMNCGEIKFICSKKHLDIIHNFFAVGARMRNGRPTCTITEVLAKGGEKGMGKRNPFASGASVEELLPGPSPYRRTQTDASSGLNFIRSDIASRRLSLGIRNELAAKARTRRSQVIRSWWHYAYGVVAYEIQKRKRRRDNFKEKYVSFDWDRQKRKREEYINLYMSLHLKVGEHVDCDASVPDPWAQDILKIEDELPIEQILLYRSIARALEVHGLRSMPSSVEVLYSDYASILSEHRASTVMSATDVDININTGLNLQGMNEFTPHRIAMDEVDDENLVSVLGKRCNDGRLYRSYLVGDDVQLFEEERANLPQRHGMHMSHDDQDDQDRASRPDNYRAASMGFGTAHSSDHPLSEIREDLGGSKVSFQYDYSEDMEEAPRKTATTRRNRRREGSDGRTVRTMKTTKTRSTMAGTVFENMSISEPTSTGAKISFAFFFKSVEVMLVSDEGSNPAPFQRTTSYLSHDDPSTRSSDDVSDLSFLSEEDFFMEQESAPAAVVEEEHTDNPMLSSTDFLLFGLPKNMLLHVTLSPLRCTILGRSGGSKNVNFSVGTITASGSGRDNLIAIGSRASPKPVPVVNLTKRDRSSTRDGGLRFSTHAPTAPKEAMTISVVLSKGHRVLQADVAKVHVCLDVPLLIKLVKFPSTSDEGNPRRTLPKSEREEARLFILRENPPSKLAEMNSSIRVHGIDLSIPVDAMAAAEAEVESSASSYSGSFERPESRSPSARITAGIVELYSGSAVSDLCGNESGAQVGSLAMLDLDELVEKGTLSSQHCVVAVSGIDCALQTETDAFAFSEAPSLLAEPVDIEMLFTNSGSTILDEDSPRQEIALEVSPIHILLSETRLLFCNRVLQPLRVKGDRKPPSVEPTSTPPRLEALSRLIMRCVDVSIRSLKISIMSDEQKYPLTPGQKAIIMEECLGDFLSIASCFDLNFPNEDALSSSMQICIDRLCGIGLYAEDAWDCTNSALLSFYEDDAHIPPPPQPPATESMDETDKSAASELQSDRMKGTSESDRMRGDLESERMRDASEFQSERMTEPEPFDKSKAVDKAIRNAVTRALHDFTPPDDEIDPIRQPLNTLLVVDLPKGAQVSTIHLFYDFHLSASLQNLFVTNTAGVRLLRIAPIEHHDDQAQDQGSSEGEVDNSSSSEPALSFSRFELDAAYGFGKGGLPLDILGSDETHADDEFFRIKEKLDDIQVGELEFFFSHDTFDDMMKVISRMKKCFASPDPNQSTAKANSDDVKDKTLFTPLKTSFFARCDIVSVLLATDKLVPFSRLRCDSLYIKKDGRPIDPEQPYIPVLKVVSRAFSLINLTEKGQHYPDAITPLYLEDMRSFPFQVEYSSGSPPWLPASDLKMALRGFRLFLLRQYINELLQFFLCELYGVGKLRHAAKVAEEMERPKKEPSPPMTYTINILDSSLILPRSTRSHDLAAIEIGRGVIFNSRRHHSFRMPTETSPFQAEQEEDAETGSVFTRMTFQLHQMRLFTSLSDEKFVPNQTDSPIFRYFYDVDGRAEHNSWVYSKQSILGDDPPEEHAEVFEALSERRWREITTGFLSLDVLCDYTPHLRLLICEPLEPEHFVAAPRLDVRLSQFCMLLSVWYDNMQEVPLMFPYPATKFLADGRNLLWCTNPTEYGTDDYLGVWDDWSCVKTEICVILRNLGLRCQFDPPGYFDHEIEIQTFYEDPDPSKEGHCCQVYFTDVIVQTYSDLRGMMRVAVAAAAFDFIDERRNAHCQRTFDVRDRKGKDETKFTTWADLSWGLRDDAKGIGKPLPQPVQISVFMTKDWALINLGLDEANAVLSELSPIWFFLGFFIPYWQEGAYGNPGYTGNEAARRVKDVLQAARGVEMKDPDGMNIDFRMWLGKPHLSIPCDLVDPRGPSLRIESETGLWYRFKSIKDYKSQEVISTGLDLVFANEFLSPRESFDSRDTMVRHLVEGLSFALRLDGNNEIPGCYHADYALEIPYKTGTKADCSIRSHEIQVPPIILDAPTICSPVETPTRVLGPVVCEITVIVEVLPLASSVMVNFFSGPVDDTIEVEPIDEKKTFSFRGNIGDLRLFAVDPVLGVQLPVAVVSISKILVTASLLSQDPTRKGQISRGESPPEDLHVILDSHYWADYFKLGVTRSWEPLLEPYRCVLLYEKSKYRGTGLSINADCPFHLNVSGALLLIFDEVIDSFSRLVKEVFGQDTEQELERVIPKSSLLRERLTVGEKVRLAGDQNLMVVHDIPKPLLGDRVAFSLCNLTGQKMRIHQQEGLFLNGERMKPAVVTYLNHDESTSLSFDATISVVKNLSVVEVPYPGLPSSQSMKRAERSTRHAVDLQLPGFRWVQGIKVDTFGRKFETLRPRSSDLLSKILQDWRLENALQLLVEVGLDNGGRLVTVRSLFEVRNNTTHPLSVLLHPDPIHKPDNSRRAVNTDEHDDARTRSDDEISVVEPGDFFQIPTYLLESSLNMGGCHLGSLWFRPDTSDDIAFPKLIPGIGHEGSGQTNVETNYCSKPVQLAKLVQESAIIFEDHGDSEISPEKAKTGIQLACVVQSKGGESLPPFCYAVEIGRSPIVPDRRRSTNAHIGGSQRFDASDIHCPVAYTLALHAPFVITNLLPETGRFELMHAVRRTVLWFGDLKPGQQMPVHSVGLDAPLLLLLNLGFCRTPVGEGALVHHGADAPVGSKDNVGLKSLVGKSAGAVGKVVTKGTGAVGKAVTKGTGAMGKVVQKGTKSIGKTLNAMSDSPDKLMAEDPEMYAALLEARQAQQQSGGAGAMGLDTGLGMDTPEGRKVHAVEGNIYSPFDVALETAVVDSIGQRLTLSIENIRGGGGQRRIAVYCPFWIVNTTQHSLRYKQEGSKAFVCGTVVDSERDGSKPVDGSTRNYVNRHQLARATRLSPNRYIRSHRPMNEGTIFAGTVGALATSPGRCDLSPSDLTDLIDKDLSLERLANLAFMFNFHEDVLSIGNRRLSVQLADSTEHLQYFSDWARGFSLDSVGFSQIVALHCREGRALELSVVVSVAPGFLSGYTKIVRFVPRYVLVNQLEFPVRLWQDSSVFRPLNESPSTTGIDELVRGTDLGKWRFATSEDHHLSVINQYEALWGRVTVVDESDSDRILEGTTAHRNANYIATAGPLEFVPFHLPDSRGERQLRVGLGAAWNLTASFASDFPGDHTLGVTRSVDLRFLRHVSTRASPMYRVCLPPAHGGEWDGELGVWFETDWGGDRRIIVKGMRRGRHCFNETDIHAGDELLRIDTVSVSRLSFEETMKLLKQRLAQVSSSSSTKAKMSDNSKWMDRSSGFLRRRQSEQEEERTESTQDRLILTFRTLEERLRRLRMKAARNSGVSNVGRTNHGGPGGGDSVSQPGAPMFNRALGGLRVEMKPLHHSMFVVLRRQDPTNPPFRIENRSMNHTIFYRQRGCESHNWNSLRPGQTQAYSWEEPMRPKRLVVRAARDGLSLGRPESEPPDDASIRSFTSEGAGSREIEQRTARSSKLRQALSYQYVEDEEQGRFGAATIVKLEEIGYRGILMCPVGMTEDQDARRRRVHLNVEVETDGATRIMVISDDTSQARDDEVAVMNRRLESLKRQLNEEESRLANLAALRYLLGGTGNEGAILQGAALSNLSLYMEQVESLDDAERERTIEDLALNITDDFPQEHVVYRRHQIVVEVLEAVGLNPENEIAFCNPYCEVILKGRSKLRKSFFERIRDRGKTYYAKKSLSPKWTDQIFVFDVPAEAVSVTRGHSIHVRVRNFRFVGAHKMLGQATVHLHSVRDQQELVGWYPLAGRTGSTELDNPLSNWGRGSVKLRIHWVHSTPALLDYLIMFTGKRLQQLEDRRNGLREQWKTASDAEKRRREGDTLKSTVSQAVPKVQKDRNASKKQSHSSSSKELDVNGDEAMGAGFFDTRRIVRDRSKLVTYFQKIAKKKGHERGEGSENGQSFQYDSEQWTGGASGLPKITEHGASSDGSSSSADTSLFDMSGKDSSDSGSGDGIQKWRQKRGSLASRSTRSSFVMEKAPPNLTRARPGNRRQMRGRQSEIKPPLGDRTLARTTGKMFAQKLFKRLSASVNIPTDKLSKLNDSSSVGDDDEQKEAARLSQLDTVKELLSRGLILHEVGQYFHRVDPYRLHGKADDGTALKIPRITCWTHAQSFLNDETLDLKVGEASFEVVIHHSVKAPKRQIDAGGSYSKRVAKERLQLPSLAPLSMGHRALQHIEYVVQSRNQFERACRRALRSVLNPGGWLTIRPITALNLPDTYTGMHVKLKYGPEVVVSSSVDAKVTPTWTPKEVMNRVSTVPDLQDEYGLYYEEADDHIPPALNMDRFEFYENDLLFYVEPQKTSGSIRLSVVGERLNNKSELGVLHIPLGAAIGSCIDCIEDYLDSFSEHAPSTTPMYVRWFPLMNPKDTDPVEGDMGLSSRPPESEQLGDDMFQQYFAPCIQLALMWWPDDREMGFDIDHEESEVPQDVSQCFQPVHKTPEQPEKSLMNNYFNADIGRISAALIDSDRAKELLSFSALDIDLRYSENDAKTRIGLVVGWVQLDHQEDKSREPVVLAPKPVEHIQPTCQLLIVKDNLRSKKNIMSYQQIRLTLEEMDLTIEESWLFDLWDFFIGVVRRREVRQKANRSFEVDTKGNELQRENRFTNIEPPDPDTPGLMSLLVGEHSEEDASAGKVYVEQLVLGLLKVNLSYVKGKKQLAWELTDKGDWVSKTMDPAFHVISQNLGVSGVVGEEEEGDPSELFMRWSQHTYDEDLWAERQGKRSQNLKGIIGAVLPNVSDAPIRLQGKVLDNVFESPSEILSSISKFYVMETLRQVYKIIGSLDFVGNPTMLFSSFVSGVRDLVVTPSVAFLRSPTNPTSVGIGVAKGTLSLFSHSTSGIFGFLAKTTAAAGQAAAMLSLDPEYRDWHRERVVTEATNLNREWKKRGIESVSAMMTKPVGDVALGVLMGVSGLVTAPYKGYRNNGKLGLAKGVAVGGIGLVAKPIVGLLDAFTHFTASVHDIAKSVNILERRFQPVLKLRLPYIFGLSNVLAPFDSVSSRSMYLLKNFTPKSLKMKKSAWNETHVASEVLHMEPGVDTYAIVTTLRVVLIKVKKDNLGRLGSTLCWEVSLGTENNKVSSQVSDHGHNGVALTITRRYKRSTGGRFRSLEQRRKMSASTGTGNYGSQQQQNPNQPSRSPADKTAVLDQRQQTASPSGDDRATDAVVVGTSSPQPDDEDQGRILPTTPNSSSRFQTQPESGVKDDPYHGHGETYGNGETLEWFTVLAEYPNRPQLTRIHNATSCILGNYDAVVHDHHRSPAMSTEGYTAFGLFDFEKNWTDEGQNGRQEKYLMAALERLPWMHDKTFEATRGKTLDEQRSLVRDIRDKWIFSCELEASIEMGGPAWLIETRAHAMFVPSEPPMPPPSIPRNDPVVKQVLYQQSHGNISREQVRELFECHKRDLEGPTSGEISNIWRKLSSGEDFESDLSELAKFEDFESAFSSISTTVVHPGGGFHPNLSEFKSQGIASFQSAHESMPTTLVRPGSGMSGSFPDQDDYDTESVGTRTSDGSADGLARHVARNEASQSPRAMVFPPLGPNTLVRTEPHLFPDASGQVAGRTAVAAGDPMQAASSEDRIGRMEGLMEQLVIFNSQLALMKGPSLAGGGGVNFHSGQTDADTGALQQEIFALRNQLERQSRKDDATTEILSGLRNELAHIRARLAEEELPPAPKARLTGSMKSKDKKKKVKPSKVKKKAPPQTVDDDESDANEDSKPKARRRSVRWFQMGSSTKSKSKKKKSKDDDVSETPSAPLVLAKPDAVGQNGDNEKDDKPSKKTASSPV